MDNNIYLSPEKARRKLSSCILSLSICKYTESDLSPDNWDPKAAIGSLWDQFLLLNGFSECEYAWTSAGRMTDDLVLIHIYLPGMGQTSYWFAQVITQHVNNPVPSSSQGNLKLVMDLLTGLWLGQKMGSETLLYIDITTVFPHLMSVHLTQKTPKDGKCKACLVKGTF